mgnify:CR=1 FL=1
MNLINFLKRRKLTLETYISTSFSGKELTEVVTELSKLGFEIDDELRASLEALLTPQKSLVDDSEDLKVPEVIEPEKEPQKPVKRNKRSKEEQD